MLLFLLFLVVLQLPLNWLLSVALLCKVEDLQDRPWKVSLETQPRLLVIRVSKSNPNFELILGALFTSLKSTKSIRPYSYLPFSKSSWLGLSNVAAGVTPLSPWILICTFPSVPAYDTVEVYTLTWYTESINIYVLHELEKHERSQERGWGVSVRCYVLTF